MRRIYWGVTREEMDARDFMADRLGRDAILSELNPEYVRLGRARLTEDSPLFVDVM